MTLFEFQPWITPTFFSFWGVVGAIAIWWIRGAPERKRAATDATKVEQDGEAVLRQDYIDQIKELRQERKHDREDIVKLSARLGAVEAENRRRGDKINNLTFIIQLVMNELQRLDPNSIILGQAARLLIQIQQPLDPNPAETLRDLSRLDEADKNKSSTLRSAEETAQAAEETVTQVIRNEARDEQNRKHD